MVLNEKTDLADESDKSPQSVTRHVPVRKEETDRQSGSVAVETKFCSASEILNE